MAAEGDPILEQALHRGIIYRRWAIGATTLASITIVLAPATSAFFCFGNGIPSQDRSEKARNEAEAAMKQSHANVSLDGHLLATVSPDRMIRLWRLPETLLQESIGVNNDVTSIAFSNGNAKLLVGFSNGILYLIDIASGRTESVFSGPV